eukprot:215007_1
MKLSIAAIALLTSTAQARLHPDDESKKNRELKPWGPSQNPGVEGRLTTVETNLTQAQDGIVALQGDVVRLDVEDSKANANITALASRLEAAEVTISAAEATISTLTARLKVLEATERIVFVTSVYYTGSLGGIAGAHSKCQDLAGKAELNGTFFPWLSSSTYWPAKDFDKSGGPFVNTKSYKVADDWQDLITDDGSGYLDNSIAFDEKGGSTSGLVWTGTSATGMPESAGGDFCDNWTSNSATSVARIGARG